MPDREVPSTTPALVASGRFRQQSSVLPLWPLYNALYPVPDYPANLWPFAVVTYLLLGAGLLVVRPAPGQLVVVEGTSIEEAVRR